MPLPQCASRERPLTHVSHNPGGLPHPPGCPFTPREVRFGAWMRGMYGAFIRCGTPSCGEERPAAKFGDSWQSGSEHNPTRHEFVASIMISNGFANGWCYVSNVCTHAGSGVALHMSSRPWQAKMLEHYRADLCDFWGPYIYEGYEVPHPYN